VKSEVKPAVAAVIIAVLVIIAVVFVYRGATSGGGAKAPMEVGNPGPFSPGGAANKGQSARPGNAGAPAAGGPGQPR